MTNFEVASPCISLCKIDEPTQRCISCNRHIEEITHWSTMSNDAKQRVMDDLVNRKTVGDNADPTAAELNK